MQNRNAKKPATALTVNRLQLSGGETSQRKDSNTALVEQENETAIAAAMRAALERKAVRG